MRRPRHAAEPAGHAEAEQIGILPPLNVRVVGHPRRLRPSTVLLSRPNPTATQHS